MSSDSVSTLNPRQCTVTITWHVAQPGDNVQPIGKLTRPHWFGGRAEFCLCGHGPTGHSAACAKQVRIDHVLDPHYATPLLGPCPLYHFYFAWRAQIGVLLPQSHPNSAHGHTNTKDWMAWMAQRFHYTRLWKKISKSNDSNFLA